MPINTEKYNRFNLDSPLHWGVKYEDLSIMWYESEYCTKIEDFGCIPHKTLDFLAASPDGINVDEMSGRYGRMLEVKNIVNRDITGIPKYDYWIQMQFQMEVCNLNECDFLETRFIEYDSKESFMSDGTFNTTNDGKPKGIMLQFLNIHGQPQYEYAPWGCNQEEFTKWNERIMESHKDDHWLQNIYWKLDEVSVVLVIKNKVWFNAATPILEEIWSIIKTERNTGFEHRAPRKRFKSADGSPKISPQMKCLIDLSNIIPDIVVPPPAISTPQINTIISIETEKSVDTNLDT